jgi:hypothetical protein
MNNKRKMKKKRFLFIVKGYKAKSAMGKGAWGKD